MRFLIVLGYAGRQVLPASYQHHLSSWVYKVLHRSDAAYAKKLHTSGYGGAMQRSFKFFNFSTLQLPKGDWRIQQGYFILNGRSVGLIVSFFMEEGAEGFIKGLFQNQRCQITDGLGEANFSVEKIEALSIPPVRNKVFLETLSPMVVSKPRLDSGNKLRADYLSPLTSDYAHYFFKNLCKKYAVAMGELGHTNVSPNPEDYAGLRFHLDTSKPPKRKGIVFKKGRDGENKVIGYQFRFQLEGPPDLLRFGLQAGFGVKNSQGFGCCGVVDKNEK